jgi:excisionase family DNA binding protein
MSTLITIEQAAERIQVTPRMIADRVRAGEIPVVRIGRVVRIDPLDFDGWVQKCKSNKTEKHTASESSRTPRTGTSSGGRMASRSADQLVAQIRKQRRNS